MSTTDEEFDIFSRQLILKEFNESSFIKLQKKKISIVGIGGIGCPLTQYLVSTGIKNINIFDNDIIKKNNLNRQTLFNIKDLNNKKTVVAKKQLLEINPHANINSYNQKITPAYVKNVRPACQIFSLRQDDDEPEHNQVSPLLLAYNMLQPHQIYLTLEV